MKLNVNGFEPNSNVGWKVVHPETQAIPTYGVMQIKAKENLLYLCLFHVKNNKFKTYKEFKLNLT